MRLASSSASLPIANATVHVLAGLDSASPADISDSDWVVGSKFPPLRAFRWDPKRGVQWLQSFGGESQAVAVHDIGNTVGQIGAHTVVWLPNGNPDFFPLTFDSASAFPPDCGPLDMNKYSVIIGNCNYRQAANDPVLYRWHAPVQFRQGVPPFAAISDDGWIVGYPRPFTLDEGPVYVLSPNNEISALPVHGQPGYQSAALGITVHGWAAGFDSSATCSEAVAWLAAPNVFRPEFRLGTCGQATGLTPDWYIVGTGNDPVDHHFFAFVWFPGTGLQRLPGLGQAGETSTALKINRLHHVVGTLTSGGVRHTVIWDVGPRPATLTADVDSLALMAAVHRMQRP
jgi:hypothetical protein